MKVLVHYAAGADALSVTALEGSNKGQLAATVERVVLSGAEVNATIDGVTGVIGNIDALWGAVVSDDVSNDTRKGLSIGKPWQDINGQWVDFLVEDAEVRAGCDLRADRVHLSVGLALAQGLKSLEEAACPSGIS